MGARAAGLKDAGLLGYAGLCHQHRCWSYGVETKGAGRWRMPIHTGGMQWLARCRGPQAWPLDRAHQDGQDLKAKARHLLRQLHLHGESNLLLGCVQSICHVVFRGSEQARGVRQWWALSARRKDLEGQASTDERTRSLCCPQLAFTPHKTTAGCMPLFSHSAACFTALLMRKTTIQPATAAAAALDARVFPLVAPRPGPASLVNTSSSLSLGTEARNTSNAYARIWVLWGTGRAREVSAACTQGKGDEPHACNAQHRCGSYLQLGRAMPHLGLVSL